MKLLQIRQIIPSEPIRVGAFISAKIQKHSLTLVFKPSGYLQANDFALHQIYYVPAGPSNNLYFLATQVMT